MQEEQGGSSCTGSKAGLSEYGLADTDQGKMLFNDPSLGGSMNDKSCNSCHPGGKGLENASGNLADTVNNCIKNALEGKGLDVDSQDMKNIIAYIRSLNK